MIDMRGVYIHPDYTDTVENFECLMRSQGGDCNHWGVFKELHKDVANNKCPICEVELDVEGRIGSSATIDHFRPQAEDMYPYLKCEPKNYILMCSLCNSRYKQSKFPLVDESERAVAATTIEETHTEQPLLFNPAEEKPLFFFELAFRKTEIGNILELKRNNAISKDSYEYRRCEAMIKLFGLGYIHKNIHPDKETKNLRVDILTSHYETFIQLAQVIKNKDKKSFALIMSDKNRKEELQKYGFFQFLLKKQFHIY